MSGAQMYTEEQKRQAVAAYVIQGTVAGAARVCNIPTRTIQSWKEKNPEWWETISAEVWALYEDELKAGYGQVVTSGLNALMDRVANGDVSVDKEGNETRVPIRGIDLAKIVGISQDKLNLIRGKPTSIAGAKQDSSGDKLEALKQAAKREVGATERPPSPAKTSGDEPAPVH